MDTPASHEATLRVALFAAALVGLAIGEALAPRRRSEPPPRPRRVANLALLALNTIGVRLVVPAGAVGVAIAAEQRGLGLLPALDLPAPVALIVALLALDLVIYLQHRVFHAVPALWRLHRVHHADRGFDWTTGVRFHPIEIGLSLAVKAVAVVGLGASPLAVLLFEAILSTTSLFNHANLEIPRGLDRALRRVVVTPDMHRVHHSVTPRETHSNFGFNLPWWDWLFRSYRAQPAVGHRAMTIGLAALQAERPHELAWALTAPFGAVAVDEAPPPRES